MNVAINERKNRKSCIWYLIDHPDINIKLINDIKKILKI